MPGSRWTPGPGTPWPDGPTRTTAIGPGCSKTLWFDSLDLVVCMDRGHQQTLVSLSRGRAGDDRHRERLVMLRTFDPGAGRAVDVPDPYYGDDAEFETCLDQAEAGCRGLSEFLAGRF